MSTAVWTSRLGLSSRADNTLKAAVGFWLLVAVIGQWAFFYYLAAFYGTTTLQGNFQSWTKNTFVTRSYIRGDMAGNLAFGAHALLAGVIAFGGALQLIPQLRTRFMSVHRWNGRLFTVAALGVGISGLYMIWVRSGLFAACMRGEYSKALGGVPISVNAVLIIAMVVLSWRSAVDHKIAAHRRWALRAYLVANGQWFFRVGTFGWIILNRGPVGIGKNFDGPFVVLWGYGCYLLPLLVLELYLRAKDSVVPVQRLALAAGLIMLTIVMGIGIVGVGAAMWWPMLGRL